MGRAGRSGRNARSARLRSGDRRLVRRRPVAPARRARAEDRRAHQRLRNAGAGGGRALGPRRRQRNHWLPSRAGARDRHLFPPQARPSPASGTKSLRPGAADPDRHRRRGFARDWAAELPQCPGALARRDALARGKRPQICARPSGRRQRAVDPHRGGTACGARGPEGRGRPRHSRQSGGGAGGQFRASHRDHAARRRRGGAMARPARRPALFRRRARSGFRNRRGNPGYCRRDPARRAQGRRAALRPRAGRRRPDLFFGMGGSARRPDRGQRRGRGSHAA